MRRKTSELIGPELEWAVTFALHGEQAHSIFEFSYGSCRYSTMWRYGGPIIEEKRLHLIPLVDDSDGEQWSCEASTGPTRGYQIDGPTPLVAAMRCFVASELGYAVDIPEQFAMKENSDG